MKIISWNLNGLMATIRNGAFAPLADISPDVLCLQEIRTAQEPVILDGYTHYWHHGDKEGYSGTAILLKQAPLRVIRGLRSYFPDAEGRALTAELPGCYVVNDWWYPRTNCNMIAEAWRTEGYTLKSLDLKKEKIVLTRDESGVSKLIIPDVLTRGKLPDNAIYELEKHMDYIIKKYGLS